MTTLTIPTASLKAIATLAPRKEVRYYLKVVRFERSADGRVLAVACNGALLGVLKLHEVPEFEAFSVPIDVIDMALKVHKVPQIEVSSEKVGPLPCVKPDGQFPDWRRIVPAMTNDVPAQFDPEYVTAFSKVAKTLGNRSGHIDIMHNGDGAARVALPWHPDFLGVLMPLRPFKGYERGPALRT